MSTREGPGRAEGFARWWFRWVVLAARGLVGCETAAPLIATCGKTFDRISGPPSSPYPIRRGY